MMLINHGMPSDGMSIGITLFTELMSAFELLLAVMIAARRLAGSAIWVAMFTSIIVT